MTADSLADLTVPALVALALLAVASRPRPDALADAAILRVSRRDLFALASATGLLHRVGVYAFNAALAEIESAPALRLVSHSRSVSVALGFVDVDFAGDEAWSDLLAAAGLDDLDDVYDGVDLLAALDVDTDTPLPADVFAVIGARPPSSASRVEVDADAEVDEKRCTACDDVKTLAEFTESNNGHHSICKACRARTAREWRKANPGKGYTPGRFRPSRAGLGSRRRGRGFSLS